MNTASLSTAPGSSSALPSVHAQSLWTEPAGSESAHCVFFRQADALRKGKSPCRHRTPGFGPARTGDTGLVLPTQKVE